jgi:presenilin-like A22 family membrane protease
VTPRVLNGSRRRAAVVLVVLVALAQVLALLAALPVLDADRTDPAVGDEADAGSGLGTDAGSGFNLVLGQVAGLLGVTLVALVLKRQSLVSNRTLLRAAGLGAMGFLTILPLTMLAGVVQFLVGVQPSISESYAIGVVLAAGLTALAGWRPMWTTFSALGLVAAVGGITLMGISIGILPVLMLCGLLLVYDALAVYGSGHMVELADGVLDLKLPVLIVIPTRGDGRPLTGDGIDGVALGLGDIVIPGLLVVASARAISTGLLPIGPLEVPLATVLALVGSLAGLVGIYALGDGAHAGLPPMLGGGLLGYFGGALVTGTSLRGALGLAGVDAGALVTTQTVALVLGIVVVGVALFLYGSRETEASA